MGERSSATTVLGTWSLPAAGLLLGAPWIKPYFADSADLMGERVCAWVPVGSTPLYCASGINPTDPAAWARIATSDAYALFCTTQALGILCLVLGLVALYTHLARGGSPRWARAALILSLAGIVPALMVLGVLAFAVPHVAGLIQNGLDVCSTPEPTYALCRWWWGSMGSTELALALIALGLVNVLTQGIAIWRSGLVSKWVALPFGVAYVASVDISPVVTLIGGVLMVIAGGWIALQLKREAAARISSRDALPAAAVGT